MSKSVRVAIDIGGTFTDATLIDEQTGAVGRDADDAPLAQRDHRAARVAVVDARVDLEQVRPELIGVARGDPARAGEQ
ncbi:MAG: hypothetical protein WB684_03000, partial [Gaiella sp.]